MPAGSVTARLNLNAAGWSTAVSQAQKQMKALQAATNAMGHGTVSSMQASSAAIRVLEGGITGNIRAAERFIGMLPGIGTALKAAFPLVGGIALAGVFVKIGTEAAEAIQKVRQMPTVIAAGFRELNDSAQTANDTMRVTNDRLENEIAKLEGKPQNNLMLAIDEARLAADKFAESLDRDNQKVKELLTQNNISAPMALLTNRASTSDVSGTARAYNQQISDLGGRYGLAVQGHADEAGGSPADLLKQINDKRASAIAKMNEIIAAAKSAQAKPSNMNNAPLLQGMSVAGPDQAAVIATATGERDMLLKQGDSQAQGARNAQDEAEKAKLQGAKDLAAAQKQAQEAIVAQWHKDLDEQKADSDMSIAQEGQFWIQRMESARKGSISYKAALEEANKDIARERSENMRAGKEFDKTTAEGLLPSAMDKTQGDAGELGNQGRAAVDYLRNLNEGISLQHRNADAIAEASLRMAVMTGQISRYDAAQAAAALHTQQYAEAQAELADAIAHAQQLPESLEKKATLAGLDNQGKAMAGQRDIQVSQDQQSIAGAQIGPAMHQALDLMVSDWKDMASQIAHTMAEGVDSLNNNIVKAMTGHGKASDFGATLSQAGSGLLKTGLQGIEGKLLGGLGFGKVDGSSATAALWVRMSTAVGGVAGGLGGGLSGILGHIPGVGSVMKGGVGDFLMGLLPHFANGGDVAAGRPIMVGERGPEPFVPQVAGTIIPHGAIMGGGGGDTHYYSVDARGSSDPAAVHAAVARALPHAVAASMQAQHQGAKRSPRGR